MPMDLHAVRPILERYIRESGHPDLITYGNNFLDHADSILPVLDRLMTVGRMRRARVLDVGCGFGWYAVAISLMGDSEVVANDMRELMTVMIDKRVEVLRAQGLPVRVTTLLGDICTADLAPASFDSIWCAETLEHVHDQDAMFDLFARVLKPGGVCVITNDNNAMNSKVVADNTDMWRKRDTSDEFIRELKLQRPVENRDIEPFATMRKRIIRGANPSLPSDEVDRLGAATAGLDRPAIEQIASRHTPGGAVPTPPSHSWCRNPETGEYCERLLHPFELSQRLASHGFKTSVRHMFRRFPLSALNAVPIRAVNARLFQIRPGFALVGTKQ